MENEGKKAQEIMHKVLIGPCEVQIPNLPDAYFDAIFLNVVLEHLSYPEDVLKMLKPKLRPNGVIISSIPNIRYHKTMIEIVFKKDFNYSESIKPILYNLPFLFNAQDIYYPQYATVCKVKNQ